MPLNHILKNPDQDKWRTIQTSNTLMKPVVMNKKEQVEQFLQQIGFDRQKDQVFKFQGQNAKELELVVEMMKERGASGKLQILEEAMVEREVEVVTELVQVSEAKQEEVVDD